MKRIVVLLVLLFMPLIANATEYPWKLRIDRDDISVYTRKVEGSSILEYKADAIINAPLAEVTRFFEDDKKITQWYYQCIEAKLLQQEGPGRWVYYYVLKLPWPVSERDCVFRLVKSVDSVSGEVSYIASVFTNKIPKEKGRVRVVYLNSIWRFTPLADGRTKVYFQQHSDPGGIIPNFLVNKLSVEMPFYSLKNLRKMVEETKDYLFV